MAFLRIAHRGASRFEVENTMNSFLKALSIGCDMLETDLRKTKDGKIVCFHDDDLKRMANKKARIDALTFEELKQISLGNKGKICLFKDMLKAAGTKVKLNLELKESGLAKDLIRQLRQAGVLKNTIFSSFNETYLVEIKKEYPGARLGLLIPWRGRMKTSKALELGCYSVHPHVLRVKKKYVQHIHSMGLKVFPYTVNTEKKMRLLISGGVDGIITDNLPQLNKILNSGKV